MWGDLLNDFWPEESDSEIDFENLDRVYYHYKTFYPSGNYVISSLSSSISADNESAGHVKEWCDSKKNSRDTSELEKIKYWCTKKKLGSSFIPTGKEWNDSVGTSNEGRYDKAYDKLKGDEEEERILKSLLDSQMNEKKENERKNYAAYNWCAGKNWSIVKSEDPLPKWVEVFKEVCLTDMSSYD